MHKGACGVRCLWCLVADRSCSLRVRGRAAIVAGPHEQLSGSSSEQREAAIEKFIAAKGGKPIIENQTRLVSSPRTTTASTPRVVGDFNAWAATPQGYDASIGKMTRIDGTNWSFLEGTSYTNARVEYVFLFDKEPSPIR